jgi:hypothetical protein
MTSVLDKDECLCSQLGSFNLVENGNCDRFMESWQGLRAALVAPAKFHARDTYEVAELQLCHS